MKLSRTHKNGRRRRQTAAGVSVPGEQIVWPTKPTKAYVAAVITLLGLVGIHLTTGTAQALVMVGQLLLVAYGVWRVHNHPKPPRSGPGVEGFLS